MSVCLAPFFVYQTSSLKVEITMPDINQLDLSGGSTGTVAGFNSSHGFAVAASGGSWASISGAASSLTIDASGGSHLDLSAFHVTSAQVNLSGGSWASVNLDGRLVVNASGGSQH